MCTRLYFSLFSPEPGVLFDDELGVPVHAAPDKLASGSRGWRSTSEGAGKRPVACRGVPRHRIQKSRALVIARSHSNCLLFDQLIEALNHRLGAKRRAREES